jgi:cytoskeleton protein RodZ
VGLDEIAQTTKIGTRFLRALETDQYDQLPGGIFNKGFIRAYARAVGIDEDQAIADYVAATEPGVAKAESGAPVSVGRMVELRAEAERGDSGDLPWSAFALVLVLAALGLAGWGLYSREHRAKEARSQPGAATESVANAIPVEEATPSTSAVGEKTAENKTTSAPAVPAGNVAGNPGRAAGLTGSEQAAAKTVVPAAGGATPSSPVPGASSTIPSGLASTVTNPGYFTIRVNVREDSWISISADGKMILQGRFLAPVEKSVRATKQVIVETQNAGGLDFEVNGKNLARQGKTDEVKTLIFGPNGLEAVEATKGPAAQN